MPTIESLTSSVRDLWNHTNAPSGPPPAAPPKTDPAVNYDTRVDQLPTPSVALATVVTRMDPVGAKLDQLKASASGPYTVNGATVFSGAQFRMSGGHNEAALRNGELQTTLAKAAARAGVTGELGLVRVGRGSPEALVKVTQALIDAGQLPAGSTKPLSTQIHDLQWKFGIGLDCAGYVYRAVAAVNGDPAKLGLKASDYEDFSGLPSNPRFQKIDSPADARPGDVLVLAGKGVKGDPGHNLVVRSHSSASAETATAEWRATKDLPAFKGPVQVFEVDTSFGAEETGRPDGGVRRDVLLYDTKADQWTTIKSTVPPTVMRGDVPFHERALTGFFRPRGPQ